MGGKGLLNNADTDILERKYNKIYGGSELSDYMLGFARALFPEKFRFVCEGTDESTMIIGNPLPE